MSSTRFHPRDNNLSTSPKRQRGELAPCSRCGLIVRWGLLVLIAGYLLFAHLGCHGDEDNELFALLRAVKYGSEQLISEPSPNVDER